ncbi:MAG: outer membrane protein assembly factor BamC [Pseudomonadota bacterium]
MKTLNGFKCITAFAVIALSGCSFFSDSREAYRDSDSIPPLEVPPDLSTVGGSELRIPGAVTTYSNYNQSGGQAQVAAVNRFVLTPKTNVRIEREGQARWLAVDAEPEAVWNKVKDFWGSNGFTLIMDEPAIGIMETEWKENREKIPDDVLRRTVGRVVDFAWSSGVQDKFRTRLEKRAGSTEIHITHKLMEEVTHDVSDGESFVWEKKPADPEREAEMLNRLLEYIGVEKEKAKTLVTDARGNVRTRTATAELGETEILSQDDFARAWRRTGLALDRVGFTINQRDRSRGIFYIRYIPGDDKEESKGFFSRLAFWRGDEAEGSQDLLIKVRPSAEGTYISVLNTDEDPANEDISAEILKLLYPHLS